MTVAEAYQHERQVTGTAVSRNDGANWRVGFARDTIFGMSDYRRYFVPGGTYFFTLVTQGRTLADWILSYLATRVNEDGTR